MNKRMFLLLLLTLTVLLVGSYKLYIQQKNNSIEYAKYIAKLEHKIEYMNYLSKLFKTPSLNCLKKESYSKIEYQCNNLSKKELNKILNKLLNKMVKIRLLSIESNSTTANLKVEILK